jgi:hypothetical protein
VENGKTSGNERIKNPATEESISHFRNHPMMVFVLLGVVKTLGVS